MGTEDDDKLTYLLREFARKAGSLGTGVLLVLLVLVADDQPTWSHPVEGHNPRWAIRAAQLLQ